MSDAALPATALTEDDFRVGGVIARSTTVLRRNLPMFFLISCIANAPLAYSLMGQNDGLSRTGGFFLGLVLATLSQAILLHGAFQDMQGQRVILGDSLRVGLRRFLPVFGLVIIVTLLGFLGIAALVVPGLVVFTNFFVATPACVVEELSVFASMRRSAKLTEGYRWRIFGLFLLTFVVDAIGEYIIDNALGAMANGHAALAAHIVWDGIWSAFSAILAVVAYHDLRVAKEGIDTRTVAAVFA